MKRYQAGDMVGNLLEWEPNFVLKKQKFTYNEIWSLAISPDGKKSVTARDNNCIINDIGKEFFIVIDVKYYFTV